MILWTACRDIYCWGVGCLRTQEDGKRESANIWLKVPVRYSSGFSLSIGWTSQDASHTSHTHASIDSYCQPEVLLVAFPGWLPSIRSFHVYPSLSSPEPLKLASFPPPALICSLSGLCLYAGQSNSHDPGRSRSISTWYLVFVL